MQGSTRKIFIAASVAVVALGFSGFASATERDYVTVHQTEVKYDDLELVKEADAAQLYARLEQAAHHVCRTHSGPSARAHQNRLACEGKALDEAVQRVSHPNLTSVHQARSGKKAMVASSR
jgi:UrcA family protein